MTKREFQAAEYRAEMNYVSAEEMVVRFESMIRGRYLFPGCNTPENIAMMTPLFESLIAKLREGLMEKIAARDQLAAVANSPTAG